MASPTGPAVPVSHQRRAGLQPGLDSTSGCIAQVSARFVKLPHSVAQAGSCCVGAAPPGGQSHTSAVTARRCVCDSLRLTKRDTALPVALQLALPVALPMKPEGPAHDVGQAGGVTPFAAAACLPVATVTTARWQWSPQSNWPGVRVKRACLPLGDHWQEPEARGPGAESLRSDSAQWQCRQSGQLDSEPIDGGAGGHGALNVEELNKLSGVTPPAAVLLPLALEVIALSRVCTFNNLKLGTVKSESSDRESRCLRVTVSRARRAARRPGAPEVQPEAAQLTFELKVPLALGVCVRPAAAGRGV